MFRKFKVFRYAINTSLTPIVETQDVASLPRGMNLPLTPPRRRINTPPTPSQEGSIKVPSWEGIEGWVKSRWVLPFKTQPN